MRKIILIAVVGLMLMIAVFVFYQFDPDEVSFFPKCPFLLSTGYKCPGCGTQRALHSLMHLKIWDALKQNAFIFFAIPYIFVGVYIEYFGGKQRYPKLERVLFGRYSAIILFVGIVLYWIVRNIM